MANYKTILIVDDDLGIREALTYAFTMEGFKVLTSANGMEALELLAVSEQPFVILLDVLMPVMAGHQFLEIIKKDEALKNIPVFIMSATAKSGEFPGAVGFIEKPFEFRSLLEIINNRSFSE